MINEKIKYIGKIVKKQGFRGYMLVAVAHDFAHDLYPPEIVFVETDGLPVPFFPEEKGGFKFIAENTIRIKLDGYDNEQSIEKLIGGRIAVPESCIVADRTPVNMQEVVDYVVVDSNIGIIGKVEGVVDIPGNVLLQINSTADNEILLPYNEDIIIEIDDDKKEIQIETPDGLFDI